MARKKVSEKICITLFKKYQFNASKRNLEFNLTIDYLYKLFLEQNKKCMLTGVELNLVNSGINKQHLINTASLDRIDGNKGYIVGNVRWVHKKINSLKSDFSDKELIYLCHLITNKHPDIPNLDINSINPIHKRFFNNETRKKQRDSNPHKKPVNQYNLDGKFIKTWDSINEARDYYNYKSEMGIISCCKGRQKSSAGFFWEYKK
jgi:hypothetical protein